MTDLEKYQAQHDATDSWIAVVEPVADLAVKIAQTDFVPAAFKGKPAAVATAILFGRELGLAPITTLRNTHVINGRPDLSAEAQRALVLAAGHHIEFVEASSTRVKMRGCRRGSETWLEVQYTLDEAKQSGDVNKNPNYKSRAQEMLVARCTTRLTGMMFPDVVAGGYAEFVNDQAENAPETAQKTVTIERETEPKPEQKPAQIAPKTRQKRAPKPAPEPPQIEAPEPAPIDGPPLPGEDGFDTIGAPEHPAEPLRTEAQSKKLFACLRSLGIGTRDEGLEMIASILGHPVESTKELTKSQAAKVIDALESMEGPIDAEVVGE